MACFFGPGLRDKDLSFPGLGLKFSVCLSLALGSESRYAVIGLFPAQVVLCTLQKIVQAVSKTLHNKGERKSLRLFWPCFQHHGENTERPGLQLLHDNFAK